MSDHSAFDSMIAAATKLGADAGIAAGTWVIDGNTSDETCRAILASIEDGDGEFIDSIPSPLSGEWADGLTPRGILAEVAAEGVDADDIDDAEEDEILTAFELAFQDAYIAQACADAIGRLR